MKPQERVLIRGVTRWDPAHVTPKALMCVYNVLGLCLKGLSKYNF